jgi:ribonuclease G
VGKRIVVNAGLTETRIAVQENNLLTELFVERHDKRSIVGSVYKGVVTNVLPGMQAAFVDIGLERTAFLHASDISRRDGPGSGDEEPPGISKLVRDGDELLVQVVKDPLGNKGARLTTFVTLPARHLVLLPRGNGVGVSSANSCL